MKICKRIISFLFCAVILFSAVFTPVANATNLIDLGAESVKDWLAGFSGQNTGVWNPVDPLVSSPVIKCKKTPRKKCSFVAEVKGKR